MLKGPPQTPTPGPDRRKVLSVFVGQCTLLSSLHRHTASSFLGFGIHAQYTFSNIYNFDWSLPRRGIYFIFKELPVERCRTFLDSRSPRS